MIKKNVKIFRLRFARPLLERKNCGGLGFMLALLAGKMYDIHHTFSYAYYGASALLILAAMVTFLTKTPSKNSAAGSE